MTEQTNKIMQEKIDFETEKDEKSDLELVEV